MAQDPQAQAIRKRRATRKLAEWRAKNPQAEEKAPKKKDKE